MAERPPPHSKGEGVRRSVQVAQGAGAGDAKRQSQSQLAFTVLPMSDDYGGRSPPTSLRQEARRWRALALAAVAVAVLSLGLLASSSAATLGLRAQTSSGSGSSSSSSSSTIAADATQALLLHQGSAADDLVQELGLNATQALLLDASRLRAFLGSAAWREKTAAAASGGGGKSGDGNSNSKSRGIVIPAGGRDHLLNALVTVRYLRRIGCALPIEIAHYGPAEVGEGENEEQGAEQQPPPDAAKRREASSARKAAAALALEAGVALVDALPASSPLSQARDLPHHRPSAPTSFGKKVWAAAYAASFREILLLDGDSLPLLDPSPLFDAPDYRRAGSMFWPDFWHDAWTDTALWRALGVTPPWQRDEYQDEDDSKEGAANGSDGGKSGRRGGRGGRRWRHRLVESGQLLLDRARHADVLEWAWMLNGPNREVVYRAMHGDKDTWRLAFDLAGKSGGGYTSAVVRRQHGRGRGEEGLGEEGHGGGGEEGADGGGGKGADGRRATGDDDAAPERGAASAASAASDGGEGGNGNGGERERAGGWFHLVPHMARDVVRRAAPGHAHAWHHVAALQAAPRGVASVLGAARAAALARADEGAGAGKGGGVSAATKRRASAGFERAIAEARAAAASGDGDGGDGGGGPTGEAGDGGSGGWPLFLHRTSFNAKFFPDCARRPEDEPALEAPGGGREDGGNSSGSSSGGGGGAAAYCRPTHASVPLADEQAARALKPHMYAFDDDQVDVSKAGRCFDRLAASGGEGSAEEGGGRALPPSSVPLLLGAALPEQRCGAEGLGERGALPVPVIEIDAAWPYVSRALDASMDVYWEVRRAFWEA